MLLHRLQGILKLLTNKPILLTIHLPVLSLFLHLIVDSVIEKSFCSSCFHDIIYGETFDFFFHHHTSGIDIWDYKNTDFASAQNAIETFNWQNPF